MALASTLRLLPWIILTGSVDARCFFSFDSRNAKQGNFSSPGHPDPYPGGSLCHYHFRGREWEGVRLVFHHFDLQPPYRAGCLSDYVEILTVDVHNTQRFRGRYCGKDTPPPLLVLTPGVELVFRSGQHVTFHQGFYGVYEFVDEETVTPPTPDDGSARRCGGVLSGTGGVLESPDFPASFPSGLDCVWLLRAAYNHFLYLRVSHLELQSSIADCRRAQLAVLDGYGPHDGSGKPLRTYCGDLKYYSGPEERALLSPRNRLLVRFTSAREAAVSASVAAPTSKTAPRALGFRLIWTQISFDTAENCTKKGQFVCRHSEFCISDSGGSSGNSCSQRRFYCVAPSLVCDGQDNCQEGDNSDEVDCYVSLLVAASIAAPLVLLIPALVVCACHRKRARRKAAMLLNAPVSTDTMTPLRPRPLHQSPSRSRPQQLSSPDHFPSATFGLISPASGFSDPLDDDNESELTEIRRNSFHHRPPMMNLSNGYCPTHGHLSHSPLPSSSDSPRGSMASDLTNRFQSPLPSSLSSPHPSRSQYPTISPRPPRQRQAATMTSPTHLSSPSSSLKSPRYTDDNVTYISPSILRHQDTDVTSSTYSVRSVTSPQTPRLSQQGLHKQLSTMTSSLTSSNFNSPQTARQSYQSSRPSSVVQNDDVFNSPPNARQSYQISRPSSVVQNDDVFNSPPHSRQSYQSSRPSSVMQNDDVFNSPPNARQSYQDSRPSSVVQNDDAFNCSTVTTFGVSVSEIPTMSQRATDV